MLDEELMVSTAVTTSNVQAVSSTQVEGELLPGLPYSAAEMLDFIAQHTTLPRAVDLLYVVEGYETCVTNNKRPLTPVFNGNTFW